VLRIALDLDGTLADLDSALDRIAEELFPNAIAPPSGDEGRQDPTVLPGEGPAEAGHYEIPRQTEDLTPEEEQLEPPELRALTRRQQQKIWETVRRTTNFWDTLDETEPGIVARLAAVAAERRWEVLFITNRPAADGETTQRQSQRWLARHGFEMPSVYVLTSGASRGRVATALSLDVVVDDRPENCLDVKIESNARAFLVTRRPAATVAPNAERLGIEVVPTVGECLDLLTAAPSERVGLLGRIRRAFRGQGD
jgi:hypothetical protein